MCVSLGVRSVCVSLGEVCVCVTGCEVSVCMRAIPQNGHLYISQRDTFVSCNLSSAMESTWHLLLSAWYNLFLHQL